MALVQNLTIEQGTSYTSAEMVLTGVDLTGYTGKCQIRKQTSMDSPVYAEPTITVTTAAEGKFTVNLTAQQTLDLPVVGTTYDAYTTFVYDVIFSNVAGNVIRAVNGKISVSPCVTRP